ncbi:right-handed parallel beta-helix repeat-containing protein [Pseudonocardia sp.]|uniref:right-handed parallel beta-helix repeat-containing protein n=1 Tax=Pseudonocardia sp. TaxID=60912 RepID=UPI003D151F35
MNVSPLVRLLGTAAATLLGAGLLAGCSTDVEPFVPREVAASTPIDPARPCVRQASLAAQAPKDDPEPSGTKATLSGGVIRVTGGENVTLGALSRAVGGSALREVEDGEWLLSASMEIAPGASVRIAAPEVNWLKLRSDATGYTTIKVAGGGLDVVGSCITSWDAKARAVDQKPEDGRGFLLARDGGRMDVAWSELRYLGHGEIESYGLSWRVAGTTGSITHSVVSHLHFGLYSYEIDGLKVTDNEFHDNALYGIDPHTGSRNMTIERNVVHDNGKHGIILAEDCVDSVIRDNVVYRNAHHGIVLYQRSDRNVIEGNETFRNTAQGINVNESHDSVVRGNRVYDNGESGIGVGQTSARNVVESNQVRGNGQDGVRLVSESADNTVRANTIGDNSRYGVYIDGDGPFDVSDNIIFGSRVGVLTKNTENEPGSNTMHDNTEGDLLAR